MTYSVWGDAPNPADCDTFILIDAVDLKPGDSRHTPGLVRLHTFEARTYDDAMRLYHEWQGWEPYRSMPGTSDAEDTHDE